MNHGSITPEFHRLVEQAVDGNATAEEWSMLESQLLATEEARDFYLDYVNLHASLRRRFLSDESPELHPAEAGTDQNSVSRDAPNRTYLMTWLAGSIALAVLVAAGTLQWSNPGSDSSVATIRLVEGEVAVVSAAQTRPAQVGDLLRRGDSLRVEGEPARAELHYSDGTQVRVHGSSVVQVPAVKEVSLELLAGSMEVEAPKQSAGQPLLFATEHSKYTAMGRFRLYREPSATRLEIDNGAAKLERRAKGEETLIEAGTVAIVAGDETPVKIAPLATGRAELLRTIPRGGERVAFSRDGKSLFANQFDAALREYRLKPNGSQGLTPLQDERVVQIYRNGQLLVWSPQQNDAFLRAIGGQQVRSRTLSPDGLFVAESSVEGIRVFSLDLKEKLLKPIFFMTNPGKAWCLALSKNGEKLAAGFWDGTVRVYEVATSRVVFEHRLQHTPTLLDMTENGLRIAVFTQRDGLIAIDVPTGEQRVVLTPGPIARSMQLTPDGKRVIAGMNDQTARMWSVDSGQALLVIEAGHSPQSVAWLEEDRVLATADGAVKLWKCNFDKAGKVVE